MGKVAKPASAINRSQHKKSNREIDTREIVEQGMQASTRDLVCPEYLTNEAKDEWARIKAVDDSRTKSIIYDSDIGMLQILCEHWSVWLIAQKQWATKQVVFGSMEEGGELMVNPYVTEMRKLAKDMKPLYAAFGLTPQGRAQMGVDIAKVEKEKDDFFD